MQFYLVYANISIYEKTLLWEVFHLILVYIIGYNNISWIPHNPLDPSTTPTLIYLMFASPNPSRIYAYDGAWPGRSEFSSVTPVRFTSPSFVRRMRLLNKMYNVTSAPRRCARLTSQSVVTCDHLFIICL